MPLTREELNQSEFYQKLKEQEEMRREQKLIQKEMERRAKFDNIDNNSESSLSQLEKFSIDKSKKN